MNDILLKALKSSVLTKLQLKLKRIVLELYEQTVEGKSKGEFKALNKDCTSIGIPDQCILTEKNVSGDV